MLHKRHFSLHIIQNAELLWATAYFTFHVWVFYALASSWLFLVEIAIAKADETLGTSWNISSH